ncbi:MAG: phosphomethylpyrimidine synthase ThiC [Elusimicrobiales bacterium]|nr:phosphomethylpyrimidine synthase ThiC [Elusimicrobiales bacterium]
MKQSKNAYCNVLPATIKKAAKNEKCSERFLLKELRVGRAVIPANKNHKNLNPIAIGRNLSTKINVNLGTSPSDSSVNNEINKVKTIVSYGADAIMDLSTGGNLDEIRKRIINSSTVPLGTVPMYEIMSNVNDVSEITPDLILRIIEKQAKQGVDFMTIHAGLLRKHLKFVNKRIAGIVSRGGSLTARWMKLKKKENPFYTHFDDILAICEKYDVTLSLGDGMRPGCIADASDKAQFAELDVLGELVKRCRKAGVQVMVEGPGHIPLNEIEMNIERGVKVCHDAPFYVLGPLITDIALGYDHINAAIGAAIAAKSGAAFLCCVTPQEHLGLPDLNGIKEGLIAFKIAAHGWNVARKLNGAEKKDIEMSKARYKFDWKKQLDLAISPVEAKILFKKSSNKVDNKFCSMCGEKFCAIKSTHALKTKEKKTCKI